MTLVCDESKEKSLANNFMHLLHKANISITQLHKITGIPLTTLKRIKDDPLANPTISTLIPLSNYFGVSLNQLLGLETLPNNIFTQTAKQHLQGLHEVPILQWEQAIHWEKLITAARHTNHGVTTDYPMNTAAFALVITEPHNGYFQLGSTIIIDPTLSAEHQDYVLVYKEPTNRCHLRQYLVDEHYSYLKPLNPDFKTIIMTPKHRIIGVIVQSKRDLKKESAS